MKNKPLKDKINSTKGTEEKEDDDSSVRRGITLLLSLAVSLLLVVGALQT